MNLRSLVDNQPTGKCCVCEESTELNIHQNCGDKLKKRRPRKRISNQKYNAKTLTYFSNIDLKNSNL